MKKKNRLKQNRNKTEMKELEEMKNFTKNKRELKKKKKKNEIELKQKEWKIQLN